MRIIHVLILHFQQLEGYPVQLTFSYKCNVLFVMIFISITPLPSFRLITNVSFVFSRAHTHTHTQLVWRVTMMQYCVAYCSADKDANCRKLLAGCFWFYNKTLVFANFSSFSNPSMFFSLFFSSSSSVYQLRFIVLLCFRHSFTMNKLACFFFSGHCLILWIAHCPLLCDFIATDNGKKNSMDLCSDWF